MVSIDIPSGLHGEENPYLSVPVVKADYTFSLQFPKLAFLFPENEVYVGKFITLDIGLHKTAIDSTSSKGKGVDSSLLKPTELRLNGQQKSDLAATFDDLKRNNTTQYKAIANQQYNNISHANSVRTLTKMNQKQVSHFYDKNETEAY